MEPALDPLSPKEIQARVRAGASAEIVAAETGWPLLKVARYSSQPLAERAYVASRAQEVELKRPGGLITLAEAVLLALSRTTYHSPIEWDAARRPDGKWIVAVSFANSRGVQHAAWIYDAPGRKVVPIDENARRLMDLHNEEVIEFVTSTQPVSTFGPPARDLSADLEKIHLVSVAADLDESDPQDLTEDIGQSATITSSDPGYEHPDDVLDVLIEEALDSTPPPKILRSVANLREPEEPVVQRPRTPQPQSPQLRTPVPRGSRPIAPTRYDPEIDPPAESEAGYSELEAEIEEPYFPETNLTDEELAPTSSAPTARSPGSAKPRGKGRRANVPTWDEILFGATRGEDT